jgi:hypothetical protein
MATYNLEFTLTDAEEKALLYQYKGVEEMLRKYLASEIDKAMKYMAYKYTSGEWKATFDSKDIDTIEKEDTRVIKDVQYMPKKVLDVIVSKVEIPKTEEDEELEPIKE